MGNTIKSGNFGEYELNIFVEKIIFVNEQIPEAGREELFYVTAVVKYTMSEITIIITCGGTVINAALVLVSDDLTSYKMEW